MEKKKTKLTISGNPKKSIDNIELARSQNKKSVIIEKKVNRFSNQSFGRKTSNFKPKNKQNVLLSNNNLTSKPQKLFKQSPQGINDYEKRKLAEQRATKRLKGGLSNKDSRGKSSSKRRELCVFFNNFLDASTINFFLSSLSNMTLFSNNFCK